MKKLCSKCREEKDITEFNLRGRGCRRAECKACRRTYTAEYLSRDDVKERDKLRKRKSIITSADRIHKCQHKSRQSVKSKELRNASVERYVKKYPEKYEARWRIREAIRAGKIIKPTTCSKCNVSGIIQAHHPDYSKPYDVIWLCPLCHSRAHHTPLALLKN
jgi:hypothetical protein